MKKEELKKEFEKKLKNITVSNELKERTLNNIYSKNNVYHLPYWIKNCAAVFVVTCLCLSIYAINDKNVFNKEFNKDTSANSYAENHYLQDITDENMGVDSIMDRKVLMKSYSTESVENFTNDLNDTFFPATQFSTSNSIPDSMLTDKLLNSTKESELSEEDFLINNPNAKKTENGYSIIKDNVEIFYELKDGFVYELKKVD